MAGKLLLDESRITACHDAARAVVAAVSRATELRTTTSVERSVVRPSRHPPRSMRSYSRPVRRWPMTSR
jgi:hypothetical protein